MSLLVVRCTDTKWCRFTGGEKYLYQPLKPVTSRRHLLERERARERIFSPEKGESEKEMEKLRERKRERRRKWRGQREREREFSLVFKSLHVPGRR
jgi:hypothetical protein